MWTSILDSFKYVMSDELFWFSMAFTTMMGIFIGSTVYDGCVEQLKKAIITIGIYGFIICAISVERIFPNYQSGLFTLHRPWASIATVVYVTIFYLLGMILGVCITNLASKKKNDLPRVQK